MIRRSLPCTLALVGACSTPTAATAPEAPGEVEAASVAEAGAPTPSKGPFADVAFMLGEWRGDEDTSFGRGTGTRSTELVLTGTYMRSANRSEFPPDEKRPNGEVHEDWEIWSFDRALDALVIRQFNSEGFVNQFVQQPAPERPNVLAFETVATENSPPGLRARLVFERLGADEFLETFEIFWPGREEPTVFRNRWRRK